MESDGSGSRRRKRWEEVNRSLVLSFLYRSRLQRISIHAAMRAKCCRSNDDRTIKVRIPTKYHNTANDRKIPHNSAQPDHQKKHL